MDDILLVVKPMSIVGYVVRLLETSGKYINENSIKESKMKQIMIVLSLILIIAGLGCTALSTLVTPAEVDRDALRYAVDAGIADFNDYDAWYPNLDEAERLVQDVDAANLLNQQDLQHRMDKDNTLHGIHRGVTVGNRQAGRQREETLFGETGILSLGLSMIGAGGFAGVLGLMRKRPGDITPQEMEHTLATATGKTTADLSIKEKQFVQLVKGVQGFLDINKETMAGKEMKNCMNVAQDTDTRIAVAAVKKSV